MSDDLIENFGKGANKVEIEYWNGWGFRDYAMEVQKFLNEKLGED